MKYIDIDTIEYRQFSIEYRKYRLLLTVKKWIQNVKGAKSPKKDLDQLNIYTEKLDIDSVELNIENLVKV